MADVEIKGMRELYEALSRLPRKMEGPILQKALAAGTAMVVKQARANIRGNVREDFTGPPAPYPRSRTGTLKRAIYAGRGKTSDPTQEVRIINVRRGGKAGRSGRNAFYAIMVEYGHRIGRRGTRLNRRNKEEAKFGRVPPKPFMRPAWDVMQRPATDAVIAKLRDLLDKAVAASRF